MSDILADYFQADISSTALTNAVTRARDHLRQHADDSRQRQAAERPALEPSEEILNAAASIRSVACRDNRRPLTVDCNAHATPRPVTDAEIAILSTYASDVLSSTPATAVRITDETAAQTFAIAAQTAPRFEALDKSALTRTIIRAAAKKHAAPPVGFVVATVPDPVDSYETWQFDPVLDGIRRAIEDTGYTFDRFDFPDVAVDARAQASPAQRDLHRRVPGVMLFRYQGPDRQPLVARETLLVLFLVPETPTAGIHHEPFLRAMKFIRDWLTEDSSVTGRFAGIIGPSFSGSTPSLARAFNESAPSFPPMPCGTIRVISGNASNDDNQKIIEAIKIPCASGATGGSAQRTHAVRFAAMVHPNSIMSLALDRFQDSIGLRGKTASITEATTFGQAITVAEASDTTIGTGTATANDLQFTVPYNIAQLRSSSTVQRPTLLDPVLPSVRPLPLQDLMSATDQPTVRTPETTGAYVELVLRNLIDMIRREGVRAVRVTMTDVRDRLFLVKELAQRAPDVTIFVVDGDLFFAHPEQRAWTRNVIVASSYPLQQLPSYSTSARYDGTTRPRQFPNTGSQGVYNATIALLNYSEDGTPGSDLPQLVDYVGPPSCGSTRNASIPPVWISVVGRTAMSAVHAVPVCGPGEPPGPDAALIDSKGYLFAAKPTATSQVWPTHLRIKPSAITTVLLLLIVFALCGLVWAGSAQGWPIQPSGLAILAIAIIAAVAALAVRKGTSGVTLVVCLLVAAPIGLLQPWHFHPRWTNWLPAVISTGLGMPIAVYLWQASREFIGMGRLLEVETGVSPLAPLLLAASIPIVICTAIARQRFLCGMRGRQAPASTNTWAALTMGLADKLALGGLGGIKNQFVSAHDDLFALSPAHWAIVAVATVVGGVAMFDLPVPVWSVNGIAFGWLLCGAILTAHWLLVIALLQFSAHWRACARLLRRLAQHDIAGAYRDVAPELIPRSVIPRRVRLATLKLIIDELRKAGWPTADILESLQRELRKKRRPRWFLSRTWQHRLYPVLTALAGSQDEMNPRANRRMRTVLATGVVLIVRELLSRLTVSLMMIAPCLAILIGIHATVSFQGNHHLLGMIWVDLLATVAIVMHAFLQMDRDTTLSLVTNTKPGRIDLNFDLASKIGVYVLLPVLALMASQFPTIGSSLASLFSSVPNLP